ncbi:DNA/RNA non-specific endonuclease [Geodermatophilus normandii]|uniref:DNA/RNA non-specific endonuclease n=1 Tax=Geodermatophilus normandii TaxID=1137989 RepID=UPI001953C72F|nr:DNA/RNA non-specific endonuclease [Geodermatophilus normandii]
MPTDTTGPSLGGTDQARTSTEECERLLAAFRRFIRTERETSPADPDTLVDLGREIAGDRTTPEITVRLVVGPERADPGAPASRGPAAAPEVAALDGGELLDGGEAADGYDSSFLGVPVPAPVPGATVLPDVARTVDGDTVVEHVHFSLQMSASRRFALWVAWNIDGGALKALSRKGLRFVRDPQIAEHLQVGDELYAGNRLDRGHIARRADLVWGSLPVAERANRDSFCFTNIAPQMDDFNQSALDGVWGRLEDAVFEDVDVEDLRVSVFGGPVLAADDRVYRGVRIPREYWKVLAFREAGALRARAFLLTQSLDDLAVLHLDEFRVFQVALPELEARTGLRFPDVLRAADTIALPELAGAREPLGSIADIRW